MEEETRRKLKFFIKKVEELSSFSFMPSYFEGGGVKLTSLDQPDVRIEGPSKEAYHAVAVGVRFFLRDGDGISFRVLANTVATDPGLSSSWKQEFSKTRAELNNYLDGPMTLLGLRYKPAGGRSITRREVLETFWYDNIIHFGEGSGELGSFEKWESDNNLALFECAAVDIPARVYSYAAYIAQLSKQELDDSAAEPGE